MVYGTAQDAAKMREAVSGCDAVIDTIGGTKPWQTQTLEQDSARVALAAMAEAGVKRFLAVSALGVKESLAQGGFLYRHLFVPTFLRGSTADKAAMEDIVSSSSAAWTIVRPPVLNDDPETGTVKIVAMDQTASKITRADVARFLVGQLASDAFVGKAVTIANS